jgi:hypothetical protein
VDCPHCPPGQAFDQGEASTSKGPSVSLITSAVQLVTTRSRAQTEQWTEQDNVREKARQWVEVANSHQATEIQAQVTESTTSGGQANLESAGTSGREIELDILDLASVQITMTLEQLLWLVPRFREGLRCTLEGTTTTSPAPVRLTEIDQRVMDCDCLNIKAIVGRQRIAGILIAGGSGVNEISMATCRLLGITRWEPCTFWLRMADGNLVRPIRMIPDLEMVMQGHIFTISVVIMDLPEKNAYPVY